MLKLQVKGWCRRSNNIRTHNINLLRSRSTHRIRSNHLPIMQSVVLLLQESSDQFPYTLFRVVRSFELCETVVFFCIDSVIFS
jgi:hypothetical protein